MRSPRMTKHVIGPRVSISSRSNRLMSMSRRPRCGSSSALNAGTTAVPPVGSAAIASAFASATRSTCRGARDARDRCARRQRHSGARSRRVRRSGRDRASPSPSRALSSPARAGTTVSGSPISLLRLRAAKTVGTCGAQSAPRMSFVVVFPAEPTTATTSAHRSSSGRGSRARRAPPPDRRAQASPLPSLVPPRRSEHRS